MCIKLCVCVCVLIFSHHFVGRCLGHVYVVVAARAITITSYNRLSERLAEITNTTLVRPVVVTDIVIRSFIREL